jgi:MarR family transcriptional regulator, 2-MHQ and catechol-resistance regulon repressor
MFRYKIKYAKDEDAKRALAVYDGLRRATDTIERWLDRQLEEFEVTMHQFALLDLLRRRGPLNQVTACEALHDGESNLAFLASTLEKRGWLERRVDANDRRNRMLHVTPEGRKLAAILAPLHACLIRAQVSALTRRDQAALQRLCEKLADYPSGLVLGELLSLLAELARE